MTDENHEFNRRLEALKAKFLANLGNRLKALRTASDEPDWLRVLAHRLAGTAGSYGFHDIGQAALDLELLIEQESTGGSLDKKVEHQLEMLESLVAAQVLAAEPVESADKFAASRVSKSSHTKSPKKQRTIVLIEDDKNQAEILTEVLTRFSYVVITLDSPSKLAEQLSRVTPDAIIVDIVFPESPHAGLDTIIEYKRSAALNFPVLFLTVKDDVEARLKAVRAGADAYILKPFDTVLLIDLLDNLIRRFLQTGYEILIVDDDPDFVGIVQLLLETNNFRVASASNPDETFAYLAESKPDVILMDINMPACNGIELAKMIRMAGAENRRFQIPIMCVTTETQQNIRILAAEAGASEYITKPIDPDFLIRLLIPMARNSREQRTLSEELRVDETRFRMFSESYEQGIVSFNHDGQIMSWNRGAESILGYNENSVLGCNLSMIISSTEIHRISSLLQRTGDQSTKDIIETIAVKADGQEVHLEMVFSRWLVDDHFNLVVTFQDVSTKRQATEQLELAKELAESASLSKTRFLSVLSHELRNSLNAISGASQLLKANNGIGNGSKIDAVSMIVDASNHAVELMNDALDLATIESGSIKLSSELFNISALIKECISLTKPLAEKKEIKIEIDHLTDKAAKVTGDRLRVKQVLINLLSNAVKYNKLNGSVYLSFLVFSDQSFDITIRDTGFGIPKDQINNIFVPFTRLHKDAAEGTGIGMTITRDLVSAMGGKIEIDSEVGEGTQFMISLPPNIPTA